MMIETDKKRMQFLLSPIKDTSNSQSYQNKLEFWKIKILEECSKKKLGVFDFKSLKSMMVLDNHYPMCLDTVVSNMLKLLLSHVNWLVLIDTTYTNNWHNISSSQTALIPYYSKK